jgi:hypothetical protein
MQFSERKTQLVGSLFLHPFNNIFNSLEYLYFSDFQNEERLKWIFGQMLKKR